MIRVCFAWFIVLAAALPLLAQEINWPEFRGPRGDGTSACASLPVKWSEHQNVRWQLAIHGRAWSSPVIWGSQVWLTTASPDGHQLYAVCVDREEGKILHDLKLFEVAAPQAIHSFNTYASPTPVSSRRGPGDGRRPHTQSSLGDL